MKWWCLFLIRDDAGKGTVEEYFRRLKVLTASTSWKVRFAANHLLPLMPHQEVHFAILPFLLSTCEELEVSWKSSKLGSFEGDLQSWLDDVARLKDTYEFPSQLSSAEGGSAAKRIHDLLDKLPIPGTHTFEVIIERNLFSDLDVKTNVLLYGSLLRAHMWHHATFRPLGVGSNSSQLNTWLDHLGVAGIALDAAWIPMWKGAVAVGNSAPSCHFELQCSVPVFELTALNKISAASEEKFLSEENVLWSSYLEILEEFAFSSLPMHLVIPLPFRLVPISTVHSMAAEFLKCQASDQERCLTVRLPYWDDVELKTKPSKPSTSEWRHNLLMERPLQPTSVVDQCLQEASGYLHFILVSNGNTSLLFPLRKTPSSTPEMCLYSGREGSSLPPVPESATHELLQDIPVICMNSIHESVHRSNSLRLAALRNFIASGQSSGLEIQELENSFNKMSVEVSDWVIDASEKPSVSPSDHMTFASLGDPADWPERLFLVSESLKGSASGENRTMSNAGGSPGHKMLSISAAEIIKLFDESGRAKRKPVHLVHVMGQSTKPSISRNQVESTYWPDVLQYKYHDMYYNTDSEVLESSCCAMRERCLVDETATTCTSSLESSTLPQSKSRKPSSKACVPARKSPQKRSLNRDRTALRGHQQKHSLSSTRNDRVASAPLRRSPRKAASSQNMPRKTVPLVRNSPQAAASPFLLRRSPRKNIRKQECDESRRETVDPVSGTAAEKLRLKLRVAVANALEKNGVIQSSPLYKPCGKKLFAICSTFAQDLVGSGRTSELLQKIADSHAKQVVKFEMLKPGHRKSETLGAS
ncbi:mdm2-binding protein-like isoform X1 [Dermacentor albipictus]|uniref:mdm2-binding protein-like isoform X1 n=2 Tax=Dermacentor albipictus TaxID=60249 RepID=UPI0031FE2783